MPDPKKKKPPALSVVASKAIDGRPKAPADLTPDQQTLWDRVVGSEPADFFKTPATQLLLRDYVRHTTSAEHLSRIIDGHIAFVQTPPEEREEGERPMSLKDVDVLMKMRDRETKAAAAKATSLRLTNQSRYTTRAAGTAGKKTQESKPWHDVG